MCIIYKVCSLTVAEQGFAVQSQGSHTIQDRFTLLAGLAILLNNEFPCLVEGRLIINLGSSMYE